MAQSPDMPIMEKPEQPQATSEATSTAGQSPVAPDYVAARPTGKRRFWKFMNPMATHDVSEFPGVLIPLSERRSSVVSKKVDNASDDEPMSDSSHQAGVLTIESLRAEIDSDLAAGGHSTSYDKKAKVINKAMQDMGMGRYQWELFILCGFGWFCDNLWLQSVAVVLSQIAQEFGISTSYVRYTTMALFIGLCIGASFWGIASDVIGRRPAFNGTLFVAGVFGLAAGGANSWYAVCACFACLGLGVGGNLPVDGALFLEFLPGAHNNLLTLLSVWWPVGTLVSSLVAWPLLVNFSCAQDLQSCNLVADGQPCCGKDNNWGWRYFILAMGGLTMVMFISRFFFFHLFESPKFLLSRGRQSEAVAVIHGIAYHNKTTTWLTEDILNEIGGHPDVVDDDKLSTGEIIRRSLSKFSADRIGPLFAYRKLALSTTLIWIIWTAIGMGYPLFNAFLPQYLANAGGAVENSPDITYRNYAITAIVGVPGSVAAYWLVNVPWLGRKGTMAISTLVTGIFLFVFTISSDPSYQLTFSALEALFQNVAYGVLYAFTPESFPAPVRGTASGMSSFLNRVAGLCAPIIAVNTSNANPKSPIYASGALFFVAFIAMILLPFETRGRQTL